MEAEHHDPWNDGTQRAMERLMALGVLVEAGSRLAAENARARANRAEQELRDQVPAADAAASARRGADPAARAGADARAREWSRLVGDPDGLRTFLAAMPFQEVARHWGQAARHASTDATAATVLAAAEEDLRRRAPALMDFYRPERDQGLPREAAMANAVGYVWAGAGPPRRHGGRPPAAGALTRLGEELDQEIGKLAASLDGVGRARLLRNLEDGGWSAESITHIEGLLDQTPASAGRDGPAQTAAQSFPVPAERAPPAHPSAKPAQIGRAPRLPRRRSL